MSVLSGGEKSRLVLAKMLMHPANFLLLDEPSNHLDMAAREILQNALQEFEGTLCLITHDRHLMNAIANRVIEVNNGRLSPYLGNYDDYLYKKGLEKEAAEKESPGKTLVSETAGREPLGRKSKEQKRYEAEVRNRFFRQTQDLRQRIQEIESALEQSMQEMQAIETTLADPEVYRKGENIADLVKFHGDLKKRTEALTSEWDILSLRLQEMEQQREAQIENLEAGENLDSRANS